MLKVLSYILCDLDPKVKVMGQKAGICDGVPSTSALVHTFFYTDLTYKLLLKSNKFLIAITAFTNLVFIKKKIAVFVSIYGILCLINSLKT